MDTPRFKCHTEMSIRLLEYQKDCQSGRCKVSTTLTEMMAAAVSLDEGREGDPDRNLEQATHWEKIFVKHSIKDLYLEYAKYTFLKLTGFELFTQVRTNKEQEHSVGAKSGI